MGTRLESLQGRPFRFPLEKKKCQLQLQNLFFYLWTRSTERNCIKSSRGKYRTLLKWGVIHDRYKEEGSEVPLAAFTGQGFKKCSGRQKAFQKKLIRKTFPSQHPNQRDVEKFTKAS